MEPVTPSDSKLGLPILYRFLLDPLSIMYILAEAGFSVHSSDFSELKEAQLPPCCREAVHIC